MRSIRDRTMHDGYGFTATNGRPTRRRTSLRTAAAVAGVLVLAAVTAFGGLGVAPLESHEIYVVQSAKEMAERCDWIVPYYNGEPRLNKPPLSYWLTAASAHLLHAGRITAVAGRVPSAVAGVWIVAVTMWCGRLLLTRAVGLWAGALLATTVGFSEYTHSARPEMVYAALCTTALLCFVVAWRRGGCGWRAHIAAWGMWTCFGLATLAKGPQIPAAMLLSFAAVLAIHAGSRAGWMRILRPIAGVSVAAAIAVPWWLLVRHHVGTEALAASELSGARFRLSPLNVLDPYYLYRTWVLLLPWVPLFPGVVWLIVRPSRYGLAARFLGLVILGGVVVLGFGGGKRWYYMLPYLPALCLLMALTLRDLVAAVATRLNHARCELTLLLLALVPLLAIGGVLVSMDASRAAPHAATLAVLAVALIVGAVLIIVLRWRMLPSGAWHRGQALAAFSIVTAGLVVLVVRAAAALDSPDVWNRHAFGQLVARHVNPAAPLGVYAIEPAFVIYGTQRTVDVLSDLDALLTWLSNSTEPSWICFPSGRLAEIERQVDLADVHRVGGCDDGRGWLLGLVAPAPTSVPTVTADPPASGEHRSGS